MTNPVAEAPAARADRDWLQQEDDRKPRGFDQQSTERQVRRYDGALNVQNTDAPEISGTAQVGATLTSSTGSWDESGLSYARTWFADGEEIDGETSATYSPVADDEGKVITVTVTASKSGQLSGQATSEPTDAVVAE